MHNKLLKTLNIVIKIDVSKHYEVDNILVINHALR